MMTFAESMEKSERLKLDAYMAIALHRPLAEQRAIYTNGDPQQNPNSYPILVPQVERNEIFSMPPEKQNIRGRPALYSVLHSIGGKSKLVLWPYPDQEYYAIFEYNPLRRRT